MTDFTLDRGGSVWEYPSFLREPDTLFNHLVNEANWVVETYQMFGKPVPTPRLLTSMFDPNLIQRDETGTLHLTRKLKVGKVWRETSEWFQAGKAWTPLMATVKLEIETFIREQVEAGIINFTGREISFSYAQLNYYRDGNDYIGYHTDSEMTPDGLIASLSLGTVRRFVLREKDLKSGQPQYDLWLQHGSLVILDCGSAKSFYKHSLPKMRRQDYAYVEKHNLDNTYTSRINVTFRMG